MATFEKISMETGELFTSRMLVNRGLCLDLTLAPYRESDGAIQISGPKAARYGWRRIGYVKIQRPGARAVLGGWRVVWQDGRHVYYRDGAWLVPIEAMPETGARFKAIH